MLYYIKKVWSYVSLFFIRGALSDKDIRKLLGYHIFIYPFKKENLKASSYNLTASKCAFIKEGDGKQKLIVKGNNIVIPKGKTAIIETQESIYVSRWITGTYHSRVKLVNMGIGHIGTTLDPCFFGVSAIALNNTTDKDIVIKVGSTIVTLMFYSLRSRSTGMHDNMSGRVDDNIELGLSDFYYNDDDKKNIAILINTKINKNASIDDKFIKDNIVVLHGENEILKKDFDKDIKIYDIDNISCKNCINCSELLGCPFKLLKNANAEKNKRKEIIKEIDEWRSQPWITNKDYLIKKVKNYVKMESNSKDIFIYSMMSLAIGIGVIGILIYYIKQGIFSSNIIEIVKMIIGAIIPTVAIVIGMIVNYNTNKGE